MISFKEKGLPHGDACTSYNVILDRKYTLLEFIDEIISTKSNEWGYFEIESSNPFISKEHRIKYGHGLVGSIPDNIRDSYIANVESNGGWSSMDYFIKLDNI